MDLTNIITSIVFAVLDVALIEYYLKIATNQKRTRKIILYIAEIVLFTIINSNVISSYIINIILLISVLILSLYKCDINRKNSIKYIFVFLCMKLIVETFLSFLFSWIFNTNLNLNQFHLFLSYKMLLQFLFRYVELIIIIFILNKELTKKIRLHYFKIISIILSIYFCFAIILSNDRLFYFEDVGRTFVFVIIIYNIALIMFDRYQRKSEETEKELLITKQNIELEKQYIKEVGEKNNQLRAFRHDIKNKMTIISGLIKSNESDKAITELESILGETVNFTINTFVNNVYVDTIIDAKVKILKEKGIAFEETYGVISIGNIGAADLALAVGLALDNAIEAVEKIDGASKKIALDIRTNKNYIIMTLTNTIQPGHKVHFSHTSKTQHVENHGFGVKKIKSIAADYDGEAKYEVFDDHVTLKLFMSINKGITKEKA